MPKRKKPKPNQETEVKLRVTDRPLLLRQLVRLRAVCQGRVHEMNTLYDTPSGALKRADKVVRIRAERPADRPGTRTKHSAKLLRASGDGHPALLTYKGTSQRQPSNSARSGRRYKIREERETRVADGEALSAVLEAVGLRPSFRYEKYRSTYRLPNLTGVILELDETPVGDFLEVEGNRAAIDRAAALLGYQPSDYITKSYYQLFLDAARKTAGASKAGPAGASAAKRIHKPPSRDMLFPTKKPLKK